MTVNHSDGGGRTPPAGFLCLAGALLASGLLIASPAAASTDQSDASWSPVAVERLVKLPGAYLQRAIENDFAGSGLAAMIRDTEGQIGLKTRTLADLQEAIDQTDGELKIELQHQFLAEKRAYLELMDRHQDLRRQQMETRQRLYDRLLARLERDGARLTPETQELIAIQDQARQRLQHSISTVDQRIFHEPMVGQSKYAREYSKTVVAIERLVRAIEAHPMNGDSQLGGRPATKKEYLRHLISETEAELQVLERENAILGYMAKLVALDAMALSELLAAPDDVADSTAAGSGSDLTAAVDFFITN
ncbi:MAG: hypothetical protein ACE5Q3_12020 [Alphaproteobacteria bacterium]